MKGVKRQALLGATLILLALAGCRGQDETTVSAATPALNVPTPAPSTTRRTRRRQAVAEHAPTAQGAARETATPVPSATVQPPATDTPSPSPSSTAVPTETPTEAVMAASTVAPSATATRPTAVIHRFELVSEEELNPGKRLTFSWSAEGAAARILGGTRQRFMPWWQVPVSGTLTVELKQTLFRDPGFSLEVVADAGPPVEWANGAREIIEIEWPCTYDYFFSPAPTRRCPDDAPRTVTAADQVFQGGRMLWLAPDEKILVLYGDGRELSMRAYDDTWNPDEAESDPELEPPQGLYQPVRGFGKVWRENPHMREALGWALAPEVGYQTEWQFEASESIGTVSYLRLSDGTLIRVGGYYVGVGSWEIY